ncbi:MAG: hypothetical protein JJ916_04015 [Phycisphaerales bacterium]|nr:hypothetical protein [Phycisphaerales bacterium]
MSGAYPPDVHPSDIDRIDEPATRHDRFTLSPTQLRSAIAASIDRQRNPRTKSNGVPFGVWCMDLREGAMLDQDKLREIYEQDNTPDWADDIVRGYSDE